MEISSLGHACFKLKNRNAVLITDPFDPKTTGLKFPKVEADIITISHEHHDHNQISQVQGVPVVIAGPGEYEVKAVKIIGIKGYHDKVSGSKEGENVIYRIYIDGISIVHIGCLGHKLDEKTLEILDDVDILLLPVSEEQTLTMSELTEVVSQLDPKIIIPMHYSKEGLSKDKASKLEIFLKEMGKEGIKPVPKLVITKDKLPSEPMVVVFE